MSAGARNVTLPLGYAWRLGRHGLWHVVAGGAPDRAVCGVRPRFSAPAETSRTLADGWICSRCCERAGRPGAEEIENVTLVLWTKKRSRR